MSAACLRTQKNITVAAVRCIESPKRSPTEAPPPAEHSYSTATRHTCAEVSAYRKILPWQRCAALSLPQPKSKILPGDPGCSLHRSFVACKTSSGPTEAPPPAEHYYSAAFFFWDCSVAAMTLRRICKCFAFFANAKVRIRINALRTFAFAGAARLQILPCGRSGEIYSGREPSVPLGGTVIPRTRNSRAAARLHGTVSSRHGDHAKTADSHTRESSLQRRCSAIKKPHLQTRFSLVGVARVDNAQYIAYNILKIIPYIAYFCIMSHFRHNRI